MILQPALQRDSRVKNSLWLIDASGRRSRERTEDAADQHVQALSSAVLSPPPRLAQARTAESRKKWARACPRNGHCYASILVMSTLTFSGTGKASVCSGVQTGLNSGKSILYTAATRSQETGKIRLLKLCHDHGGSSGCGCAWNGASGSAQA